MPWPHNLKSGPPRANAACVAAAPNALTPPGLYTSVPSASYARLSTRQYASAFNQALSFDMRKVTDENSFDMFHVRSHVPYRPTQP